MRTLSARKWNRPNGGSLVMWAPGRVVLTILLTLTSITASANPFWHCAAALKAAGSPSVEIVVQGEYHTTWETRSALNAAAEAGEIYLLAESIAWDEEGIRRFEAGGRIVEMHVSPQGPVFGMEHSRAAEAAQLLNLFSALTSPTFGSDAAGAMVNWRRFIGMVRRHPETWRSVTSDSPMPGLPIVQAVEELRGIAKEDLQARITQVGILPDVELWREWVATMSRYNIDKIAEERPGMREVLEHWRALFCSPVTTETLVAATAASWSIRERFMAEQLARIIAGNLGSPRPYVILIGAGHVRMLTTILREHFADVPNVYVSSNEIPLLSYLSERGNHLRALWRPE